MGWWQLHVAKARGEAVKAALLELPYISKCYIRFDNVDAEIDVYVSPRSSGKSLKGDVIKIVSEQ